ncbi:inositol monophosphatase [Corynebacterium falsenii]|uniref:inositol monophosphatase family protein n=1 Tax=Corynebacterium falsenii TaxID=108486 RepID=UPI001CC9CCD5|nr:inositol monophosphatase family protein [Corynebacterium falsenii]UBI06061.1 inositol monophosphatase [Corynebacterium falsenii]
MARGSWWVLDGNCTNGRMVASRIEATKEDQPGASTPAELESIALTVGLEAAELVRTMRADKADDTGAVHAAATKSSAVDPVTEVDQASERLIRRRLLEELPGSTVLGEEEGGGEGRDDSSADRVLWVVDPIDGTVNFMYGVPAYAVSIAATVDGLPVAAAVIDVAHETSYVAHVGGPARKLTGQTETVLRINQDAAEATEATEAAVAVDGESAGESDADQGNVDALATALVATGFAYLAPRREAQAELLTHVLGKVRDIRRMGSAALDLCHVASGEVDAYYEHGLGPWDHAAGVLIAARAGAMVLMPNLTVQSSEGLQVMAAKPDVFAGLGQLLDRHTTGGALYPVS